MWFFLSSFYLELILDLDIYLTLSLRFMTLSLRLCDNRFYVLNAIWQFLLHFFRQLTVLDTVVCRLVKECVLRDYIF